MTESETADPTYGKWSYPAFFAGLGLYSVTIVALAVGVNATGVDWLVGTYWIGVLAGLVALEQWLERRLF